MNGFRAELPSLTALVARLSAFEVRAESLATELDAQARRLHGEWTGAAATEHRAAHDDWMAAAAAMRAAVLEMRSSVDHAHANYCAAVTANQRMWG